MFFDYGILSLTEMQEWELYSRSIRREFQQSLDEGKDIRHYEKLIEAIEALDYTPIREELADIFYKIQRDAPLTANYPYHEPNELTEIRAVRPSVRQEYPRPPIDNALREKIEGAWLGRICGCLLGKPVECWGAKSIKAILQASDNYPLHRYVSTDDIRRAGQQYIDRLAPHQTWIDTIDGYAPNDDDTNYTVLAAVGIIGHYGRGFTSGNVASAWLNNQLYNAYATAEHRAYRNFIIGIQPPYSAAYKNPDRELIGAQIRGDYFGYINPGAPEVAADMAWRDARISHVKNGIYGEMMVAAMLAAAAVTSDACQVIQAGLNEIPEKSRLAEAVRDLLNRFANGETADEYIHWLQNTYDESIKYDEIHTIPNLLIVLVAILYASNAYGKAICMAVQAGFDTDCNGATVGSIIGMMHGKSCIEDHWTQPICGKLQTNIMNANVVSVESLVELTLSHIELKE